MDQLQEQGFITGEERNVYDSPEMQAEIDKRLELMTKDATVVEDAPWMGKTGLDLESERELSRYLRREFGQVISDPGALKAADLIYVGVFIENGNAVRYWKIPGMDGVYAYIDEESYGWGGRTPVGPK